MDLFKAMQQRRSARAFLDKPVARADIEELFDCAGLAPSAINIQPWQYVVTCGEEKERLVRRLQKAHSERRISCGPGASAPLPTCYTGRSRETAQAMKACLDPPETDFNQFIEQGSCAFYGAPAVVIVTIDKRFPPLRYLDLGLGVAYLLLAAEAKGLATCPIGLITAYAEQIADVLNIPEDRQIVLGIALGHADPQALINAFKSRRAARDEILQWYV